MINFGMDVFFSSFSSLPSYNVFLITLWKCVYFSKAERNDIISEEGGMNL